MHALFVALTCLATQAPGGGVGTEIGQVYPDFELPTVDGSRLRLSDTRGGKVLLVHFASW